MAWRGASEFQKLPADGEVANRAIDAARMTTVAVKRKEGSTSFLEERSKKL
jgi:hypothetical protein